MDTGLLVVLLGPGLWGIAAVHGVHRVHIGPSLSIHVYPAALRSKNVGIKTGFQTNTFQLFQLGIKMGQPRRSHQGGQTGGGGGE